MQNTYYWVVYLHTVVHKENQAYNKPSVIHFIYFNSLEIDIFFHGREKFGMPNL